LAQQECKTEIRHRILFEKPALSAGHFCAQAPWRALFFFVSCSQCFFIFFFNVVGIILCIIFIYKIIYLNMEKQLIKEAKRLQELAGINEVKIQVYKEFDIDQAFNQSPNEYSYEELLDVVDSYEDEKYFNSFISTFQPGQSINKEEWVRWNYSISDYDPEGYVRLNWISLSDPDVYSKAGV
jgi:hypothetical protein